MKLSELLLRLAGRFELNIRNLPEQVDICEKKFLPLDSYEVKEILEYTKWCRSDELEDLKVLDVHIQAKPDCKGGVEVWIDVG